jgi:plastocyanin
MQLKLAAFSVLSSALLAAAQDAVVQVGGTATTPNGAYFQFIPPTITATKGSVITFKFTGIPGNHTITQSSFAEPCTSISGGFDSGYVFVPGASVTDVPQWNLTITDDTTPIWFFCKQLLPTPHCPAGMVGAINPPTSGNTFESFQTAAKAYKGTINVCF